MAIDDANTTTAGAFREPQIAKGRWEPSLDRTGTLLLCGFVHSRKYLTVATVKDHLRRQASGGADDYAILIECRDIVNEISHPWFGL